MVISRQCGIGKPSHFFDIIISIETNSLLGKSCWIKSCWIIYALHHHLTEGKPVVWYHDSKLFLFVKEGVSELPADFPATTFNACVWTFPSTKVTGSKGEDIYWATQEGDTDPTAALQNHLWVNQHPALCIYLPTSPSTCTAVKMRPIRKPLITEDTRGLQRRI